MIVNFDNAATTFPKPVAVKKAVAAAMEQLTSPGRGGHPLGMKTSEMVYSARETAADFFGAEPENVVFTLNCTYALNMAIQGIMKNGGHLIIGGMEHNSVARPAAELAKSGKIRLSAAEIFPEKEKTVESFRKLIRSDTKAIVCTAASNVTGQIMPVEEIGRLCKSRNIAFIVDAAQASGIVDLKLSQGINIICTAGHKGLYGITGTGMLISDGKFHISPIIQGGTGSGSHLLEQPTLLPEALESGTVGTVGIMSMKAGMEFVRKIGIERIFSHEDRICRRFVSELEKSPKITIYRQKNVEYVPIVSFSVEGKPSERVAEELGLEGFCLRAGYHCAAMAHSALGTKNGTVRFSPSIFSREEDAAALARLILRKNP